VLAESPKYRALYDPESGVVFSRGRAEVTEEQAVALAKRRFVDGILIEGVPAKKWVQRQSDTESPHPEPAPEQPREGDTRKAR